MLQHTVNWIEVEWFSQLAWVLINIHISKISEIQLMELSNNNPMNYNKY